MIYEFKKGGKPSGAEMAWPSLEEFGAPPTSKERNGVFDG